MPSSRPEARFLDIIQNIRLIQTYVAGMDRAAFEADSRTRDAVERCLARISEASSKLCPQTESMALGPYWPAVRAFGNVLRHAYDQVEFEEVWEATTTEIPARAATVEAAVKRLDKAQTP